MSQITQGVGLLVALAVVPPATAAQTPTTARLRVETPSFVFARYASGSASALYVTRGLGAGGAFVAMVQNPETQYRELIGGAFTQLNWSGQSVLLALAYADATDGHYAQTYVVPSFFFGRVSLS